MKKFYDVNDAQTIGDALRINWGEIDLSTFHIAINIELEESDTDRRNDMEIGKIAITNLQQNKDYYNEFE